MMDAVDDLLSAQAGRFLGLALGWHVLWGAFLLPYAIGIALILGGQAAAQDLVDNLASTFFEPILFLVASLPLNGAVAGLSNRVLAGSRPLIRFAASAGLFLVAWLVGVQVLLTVLDPGGGTAVHPIAIWAALAGAAYGLILPLFDAPLG